MQGNFRRIFPPEDKTRREKYNGLLADAFKLFLSGIVKYALEISWRPKSPLVGDPLWADRELKEDLDVLFWFCHEVKMFSCMDLLIAFEFLGRATSLQKDGNQPFSTLRVGERQV